MTDKRKECSVIKELGTQDSRQKDCTCSGGECAICAGVQRFQKFLGRAVTDVCRAYVNARDVADKEGE
jgi:hypothetical protein